MQETQNIEFKREWKDEYLKVICAFANAFGGILYVGVNDDGTINGTTNHSQLLEEIPNKSRDLLGVTISAELKYQNNIPFLEIKTPSYSVPISLRGRYYFRSGTTILELTGNSLNEFLLGKFGKTWDDLTEETFSLSDIDLNTIEDFKRFSSDRLPAINTETDPLVILNKLNLLKGKNFKRAAILLFAKEPQRIFKQAHVKIGRFLSDVDIVTSDIVEGNLFKQLDQTIEILKTKYLLSPISYEGIHRREKLEYPYLALREALLNALIHRNYLSTSAVQIRVYSNKLIIMNEGELPDEIKVEDLFKNHLSKPRNPIIADVFYKSGFIEGWGRGTLKIVDECFKEKLPTPEFESNRHLFSVTFFKTDPKTDPKTDLKTDPKTQTIDEQIIAIITYDKKITIPLIANKIGKGITVTKETINKLKTAGRIKRIGPAKGGYWQVIEKRER